MTAAPPSPPPRRRRRWPRIAAGLVAALLILTIDLAPSVPAPAPPTGLQAERTRALFRTVRTAMRAGDRPASLTVSAADLAGATALASRLDRIGRASATIVDGELVMLGSRRLIGPLWLNVRAAVPPSSAGFPAVRLRIGRLPLGATVSRWVIAAGAQALRWRGIRVPPLDRAVRRFSVAPGGITASLQFPLGSGLIDGLPALRQRPIDAVVTAAIYCRLVAAERRAPAGDLAAVVRRAFALPAGEDASGANRARFVGIAMYVVSPAAGRLAGNATARARRCGQPRQAVRLAGRPDLAKHWALSAALTASVGDDVGAALGEWKELADSRPSGSGFSFVDLAADRAGVAAGRRGMADETAATTAARLATATEADLLPLRALALSEGLSEAAFVRRYGSVDSGEFDAAVARIDRLLAGTVGN